MKIKSELHDSVKHGNAELLNLLAVTHPFIDCTDGYVTKLISYATSAPTIHISFKILRNLISNSLVILLS